MLMKRLCHQRGTLGAISVARLCHQHGTPASTARYCYKFLDRQESPQTRHPICRNPP